MNLNLFFTCDFKYFLHYLQKNLLTEKASNLRKIEFDLTSDKLVDIINVCCTNSLFIQKRYFIVRNFDKLLLNKNNLLLLNQLKNVKLLFFLVENFSTVDLSRLLYKYTKIDSLFKIDSLVDLAVHKNYPNVQFASHHHVIDFFIDYFQISHITCSAKNELTKNIFICYEFLETFKKIQDFLLLNKEINDNFVHELSEHAGLFKLLGIERTLITKINTTDNSDVYSLSRYKKYFWKIIEEYGIFLVIDYLTKICNYFSTFQVLQSNKSNTQKNGKWNTYFYQLYNIGSNFYDSLYWSFSKCSTHITNHQQVTFWMALNIILYQLNCLEEGLKSSNVNQSFLIDQFLVNMYDL